MSTRKRSRSNAGKISLSKRRRFRRNIRRSRVPRGPRSHYFKRMFLKQSLSGTGNLAAGMSFQMSDLPGSELASLTDLFDMYRLSLIKLTFIWGFNGYENTQSHQIGRLFVCKDFNGISVPSSSDEILQYDTCKFWQLTDCNGKRAKLLIRPKIQAMTYLGIGSTGYVAKPPGWCNMSDAIPHYGVRLYVENSTPTYVGELKIYATYYFKCRFQK